jgi:hypothetical protein
MKTRYNDVSGLLPDYIGGTLDEADAERVRIHLIGCRECDLEISILKSMTAAEIPDPGDVFFARARERAMSEFKREKGGRTEFSRLRRFLTPVMAAAAACCLIIVMFAYFHHDNYSLTRTADTEEAAADKYSTGDEAVMTIAAAFEFPSPLDDEDYADMLQAYVEEPESHISDS